MSCCDEEDDSWTRKLAVLLDTNEIQNITDNKLEGISVELLQHTAWKCLHQDSGHREIKTITKVLSLLDQVNPSFHETYVNEAVNADLDTVFLLHLLCSLSDRIFQGPAAVLKSARLWSIVQAGLTHSCSLTRKRALFLMKRFTDSPVTPNSGGDAGVLFGTLKVQEWEEYYLLLETLEEKQVHIVQQIMARLGNLVKFHPTWVFVIFKRFFAHQNLIVVKWGLEAFLALRNVPCESFSGDYQEIITASLMEVLNESKLYSIEGGEHSGQTLCTLLVQYFNHLLQRFRQEELIIVNSLVKGMCGVSWGPLPLFWVTSVLPLLQCKAVLQESAVLSILDLVEHHMVYQEPILRGASQHNLLTFIFSKLSTVSKPLLENCLFTFWRCKVFFIGSPSWEFVQSAVLNIYNNNVDVLKSETLEELRAVKTNILDPSHLVVTAVIKSVLPLVIANSSDQTSLRESIRGISYALFEDEATTNRPYAQERFNLNQEQADRLKVILLKSIHDILKLPTRRKGKDFLKYLEVPSQSKTSSYGDVSSSLLPEDLSLLVHNALKLLKSSEDLHNIEIAKLYVETLDCVQITDSSEEMRRLSTNVTDLKRDTNIVSKAISLKTILTILKNVPSLKQNACAVLDALPMNLSFESAKSNRENQKMSGQYFWQFCNEQILLLALFVKGGSMAVSEEKRLAMLEYAQESLDLGGNDCAVSAMELVSLLDLPALGFIQQARRVVLEFRKNEMFWPALQAFLNLAFKNLANFPSEVSEIIEEIALEANAAPGIMGLIISSLHSYLKTSSASVVDQEVVAELVISLLARGVGFGPTFRKDQRIVTETNRIISEEGNKLAVNSVEGSDHVLCQSIRIQSLEILLDVLSLAKSNQSFIIKTFLKSFAALEIEVSKGRQRHFENSEIHKLKNRMMQAILVLASFIGSSSDVGPDYKLELLNTFLQQLLDHNDQTSVRYLLEWSCTILIASSLSPSSGNTLSVGLEDCLWDWLKTAGDTKISSIQSFLQVVTSVACLPFLPNQESYIEHALVEVSPWSMAQQFGVRVVAQMSFNKLWEVIQLKFKSLETKYSVLRDCLRRSVQFSDKSTKTLTDDFYLTVFSPLVHYTLEDIFVHLPTLCNLNEDEVIPREVLDTVSHSHLRSLRLTGRSSLEDCPRSKLIPKESPAVNLQAENIQRKITPWKSMNIETGHQESQRFSKGKKREYEDLIVIASLIDRLPNLGGLCRTCEIFGVGKMTVPSMSVVKEKDFTGISVTAESWIPLEGVAEPNLADYLSELKRNGWTIVAIEQASKSVPLQNFSFPQKCAILLGKEREGVPVDLLNLVDECVEIPQHGLIRSFNVHVTGAMVLWEYVRQQLL